jgi:SAM-dependent methyltransferase
MRSRPGAGHEFEAVPEVRACWEPLAAALLAYDGGETEASILVVDDLGDTDMLPAAYFFRSEEDLPPLELEALALCKGRVLDFGAGAGCHALVLQERGHSVCAVEILPELVELLSRRGVLDGRPGSVFHPPSGRWDTVLMLMNGWGLAETVAGLERFLASADRLLAPGGQMIADSTDMRRLAADWRVENGHQFALREDGRYVGEIQFQLEYDGRPGDPFTHLYVDPDTLGLIGARTGWDVEIVAQGENGGYLSRLRRSGERAAVGVLSRLTKNARNR